MTDYCLPSEAVRATEQARDELYAQNEELRRALQNRKEQSVTWRRMYEKCAGERDMARKALHIAECRATGAAEQYARACGKISALQAELDAAREHAAGLTREASQHRGHRILAEERLKRLTDQVQSVDKLTGGYMTAWQREVADQRPEWLAETPHGTPPLPLRAVVNSLILRVERLESGEDAEDRRS